MQTAKVLPEGESSAVGAFALSPNGRVMQSQYTGRPDKNGEQFGTYKSPTVSPWYMLKYGLGYGADAGIGISLFSVESNVKFQVLNIGNYYMATGAGLFFGLMPNTADDGDIYSSDLIFPVYMSYDISSKYSVYGAGKFIIRNLHSSANYEGSDNSPRYLLSGTIGNKIDIIDDNKLLFEVCLSKDLGVKYYSGQFNIGVSREY
jgi:hypothetical protein